MTEEQKEASRRRCREWYARNRDKQRKRVLDNYYKFKADPVKRERLKQINRKAKAIQRYGVEDREILLKKFNHACANCGSKKNLAIHHIDNRGRKVDGKEKPNNHPDNLIVVCAGCHVNHHTRGDSIQMKV